MFCDETATPERNLRCAVPRVAVADAEGRSLVPGGETCRVEGAGAVLPEAIGAVMEVTKWLKPLV